MQNGYQYVLLYENVFEVMKEFDYNSVCKFLILSIYVLKMAQCPCTSPPTIDILQMARAIKMTDIALE